MNNPRKAKVVVVGSGPSGLTTALFLAKKQIHTLVLDKSVFPRHKSCGDNISGNALRILNELDPSWIDQLQGMHSFLPMDGVIAYAPNGHHLDLDFLPLEKGTDLKSCYSAMRSDFDFFLLQRAKENPFIDVIENCFVTKAERIPDGIRLITKTGDTVIEASLVVFCTGSNSILEKDLCNVRKENKHVAVGVRAYFKEVLPSAKPNHCELLIHGKLLPGGIYLTPLPNGLTNVNVVMRSDVLEKRKLSLTAVMNELLTEHPLLKERFRNAVMVGKPQGSSLFLGTKKRKLSGNNYLLVGDAAGLIDLLSANGIPQAMLSAKIASEQIYQCILSDDFSSEALKNYDKRVHQRLEGYLKLSRYLAPLVGNRIFLKLVSVTLNYIARKFNKNDELRNVLYEKNIFRRIINPTFYYRLFFGIKNSGELKSR